MRRSRRSDSRSRRRSSSSNTDERYAAAAAKNRKKNKKKKRSYSRSDSSSDSSESLRSGEYVKVEKKERSTKWKSGKEQIVEIKTYKRITRKEGISGLQDISPDSQEEAKKSKSRKGDGGHRWSSSSSESSDHERRKKRKEKRRSNEKKPVVSTEPVKKPMTPSQGLSTPQYMVGTKISYKNPILDDTRPCSNVIQPACPSAEFLESTNSSHLSDDPS